MEATELEVVKHYLHNDLIRVDTVGDDEMAMTRWISTNRNMVNRTDMWPIPLYCDMKPISRSASIRVCWQGWNVARYVLLWCVIFAYLIRGKEYHRRFKEMFNERSDQDVSGVDYLNCTTQRMDNQN